MPLRIVIPGEVPSKKNSRINTRSGRSFPSCSYMRWHDVAMFHALSQAAGRKAPVPCGIGITVTHGDMRRRDLDNEISSVLDMLVDAGILDDDGWMHVRRISAAAELSPGNPRLEIAIEDAT